ncbi:hypothetical protein [Haliangium ochraceum]|uniref:Lipoprotein n=1 Tax=Haliangium ochraceum (strain DSM 14365 / JCM 11303 / SMP-2) TaxID=502025 RepID=D0LP48_HALO1|nr:hypothetical protein [Haliangium ochraceum]ACY18874.1 hypothetical protein Hoch_6405 [Haliangium ochraceum DSM 14365]
MLTLRTSPFLTAVLGASLLAAPLALSACSKDKKDAEEGTSRGLSADDAKDKFSYLPPDANLVVTLKPPQIASSKLYKDLVAPSMAKFGGNPMDDMQTKCGFDPLTTVTSVTFGGNTESDDSMVVSVEGLTHDQFAKCAGAMAADGDDKVEVSKEGDLTKISANGDDQYAGWINDTTMVISPKGKTKEGMEEVMARKEGMGSNAKMMELVGQVDMGSSIWFAMHNSNAGQPVGGVPVQAQAMYGALTLGQGMNVDMTMEQASAEEAKDMVAELTQQLEGLKAMPFGKFVGKAQLEAKDKNVNLDLALSEADMDEMVPMLEQQLLPMLMMMGGGGMGGMGGAGMGGMGGAPDMGGADMGAEDMADEPAAE